MSNRVPRRARTALVIDRAPDVAIAGGSAAGTRETIMTRHADCKRRVGPDGQDGPVRGGPRGPRRGRRGRTGGTPRAFTG
jgi:hypothetical protein